MKLKDLYSLPPISVEHNFSLAYEAIRDLARESSRDPVYKLESFVNTIGNSRYGLDEKIDSARFQINMYMDEGDDKYGARLYTVVFDGVPIMMVKNNGRYYDDYNAYLSNEKQLYALIDYIYTLVDVEENSGKPEVISEEQDIADLTEVGNYELFDYYDNTFEPKYKMDDLVWAWVPENHLRYDFSDDYQGYVLTQVRITDVNKFKRLDSYHGSQRERGWDQSGVGSKMKLYKLNEKGVGIGCSLNDDLILGKVGEIDEPKFALKNFVDSKGFLPKSYKMELNTILRKKLEEAVA
jgi:hypothetical protein